MPHKKNHPTRTTLRDEPVTPHPPTTTIRVFERGRTVTLQPLADVLSPNTRATLDAIAKKDGRQ